MRKRYLRRLATLATISTAALCAQCGSPSSGGGEESLGRQQQAECSGPCDDGNPCTYSDYCGNGHGCLGTPLPPQDACWNKAVDPGIPTRLYDATRFLWTGGIQTGVAEGVVDPERVAVIRGKVRDRAGVGLQGVTVTVGGHGEFGSTTTLGTDGWFDMVVNGGGELVVKYEKAGYLPVERKVKTPWKDYVIAGDVAMTPVAGEIGTFTCPSQQWQAVHTNPVDGRQLTVLFPPNVCVDGYPSGGTFSVRAVEYTTSTGAEADDPASMPAELPPASQFTFAAELQLYVS